MSDDGWESYRRLVIAEFERINTRLDAQGEKLDAISTQVTILNVKSGLWGALAGIVSSAVMLFAGKRVG